MRRERSFVALLVVAMAFGSYVYFVERKRPASGESPAKPKVFEKVESDKIDEIAIATPGEKTQLKKIGGKWQIVQPISADADSSEIGNLTSNLSSLDRDDVVEENPGDLKQFGLNPPKSDVTFHVEGSKGAHRLLVGNRTPTGGELYAKLPDEKRVFLISGFVDQVFNRTTFDLRDKTILKFDRDKVDAVDLTSPDHTLQLVHDPSEWRIAGPVHLRADFGVVEGIVGRLATAQMKSIVAPDVAAVSPADLKKYGLEKPAETAAVTAGSARAALVIGAAGPDGNYYARDLSRPLVFTVESSLVDDLKKAPGDFRRKDVFDYRPFNATRLEVTRNGKTTVFEKVKNPDPKAIATEIWKQTAPAAKDVKLEKADAAFSGFSNLRADSWTMDTAALGLDKPEATIVAAYDKGAKHERITFSRKGSDVYAARADEPGAAKIPTPDYESALKALDEILK